MVTVVLLAAALALSGYSVITSNGKSALGWAVVLLAFALLWPRM